MRITGILLRASAVIAISASTAGAQSLELGAGFNHLSSGFQLLYQLPSQSRWTAGAGLRVMVNTYALNENKEDHFYYQNGYAAELWEHFGLTGKVRFKIVECYNIGLEATSSMLLTWHGLKRRSSNGQDIVYTNPGLALEAIIGPGLYYNVSKRLRVTLTSGLGVCITDHYTRDKKSLATGETVNIRRATGYNGPYDIEYVGIGGGLPMIYAGVVYKL